MFDVKQASRGGAPLFQPFHILKALWCLKESPLSRKDLSMKIGIGEGSTRKLLEYMETEGWASSSRKGIILGEGGADLLESLGFRATEVEAGSLTVGDKDFGICLGECVDKVSNGIEQRDEAMKVGALGATTLVFRNGTLTLSDGFDIEAAEPVISQTLIRAFDLSETDVLILGSAPSVELAQNGAFAAAVWTLQNAV
jgi:hypothetical protein